MKFEIRKTNHKEETAIKSLYMTKSLIAKVNDIATKNNTSFNNVVVSMIEHCLKEDEE